MSPEQLERVRQIRWQWLGMAALGEPDLAKRLELTDEQRVKIKEVVSHATEKESSLVNSEWGNSADEKRAFDEKLRDLKRLRELLLSKVLNDDQTRKFAELKGPPFDLNRLDSP